MNVLRERNQNGFRISDSLTKSEPGSQGDALDGFDGSVAKIDRHQAKSAGLDQQVRGFDGVLHVAAAADPQDLR